MLYKLKFIFEFKFELWSRFIITISFDCLFERQINKCNQTIRSTHIKPIINLKEKQLFSHKNINR